jgi:hypothetical protein
MLRRGPSLDRYRLSKERNYIFNDAWSSVYFGGSVLNPLGAYGKRRNRYNPLE